MTEYIKKSEALDVLKPLPADNLGDPFNLGINYARRKINAIPAADVSEVICGRWEEVDWVEPDGHGFGTVRTPKAGLRCNQCSNVFKKELLWKRNYCPECGAKMDLED